MKKHILYSIFSGAVLVLLMAGSSSCTEWNEFKKYTEDGEIVYPGKITSLKVFSGEDRVKIMGTLGSDPRVTKLRIFWDDYADSVEIEATNEVKASGFEQIVEATEGLRTYVVHTYDEFNNESLPVSELGVSYGEIYRSKIRNKEVSSIHHTDSSTLVIWKPIDLSTGAQYISLDYTAGGVALTQETAASMDTTELIGLEVPTTINYHTVYLPSPESIDLFYTDTVEYSIQ